MTHISIEMCIIIIIIIRKHLKSTNSQIFARATYYDFK